MDEAVAEIERALELDPVAGATRFWLCIMLLLARQYDRAIDEAQGLLELEPNSPWPHYVTGVAYRQKYFEGFVSARTLDDSTGADFAERAIAGHLKAIDLSSGSGVLLGWLGLALGVCGQQGAIARCAGATAAVGRLRPSHQFRPYTPRARGFRRSARVVRSRSGGTRPDHDAYPELRAFRSSAGRPAFHCPVAEDETASLRSDLNPRATRQEKMPPIRATGGRRGTARNA